MIEGPNGAGLALVIQSLAPHARLLAAGDRAAATGRCIVTSIAYTDPAGEPQALAPALYELHADRQPAVIARAPGAAWPPVLRGLGAVRITFVAGHGAAASAVPADLRAALLLMVGHLYHNREAAGQARHELPLGFSAIVERHRVGRFGA
jgi:uncharacterized phiE125 gp8 family phage protein